MTLLEYFKKEANNMLSIYPACFFEEEKHYSVIFPDFNYLSTCGDSLQDAMEMAVDCLAGALFSAKLDNEDIPIPSKLEEMDPTQIASELEFEFKQSFVTLVSVDVEEYAKTHYIIKIPYFLLRYGILKLFLFYIWLTIQTNN